MEDLGDSNSETLSDRKSSRSSITCAGRLRALTQRLARESGPARLCRRTPYTSRPLPPLLPIRCTLLTYWVYACGPVAGSLLGVTAKPLFYYTLPSCTPSSTPTSPSSTRCRPDHPLLRLCSGLNRRPPHEVRAGGMTALYASPSKGGP